MSSERPGITNAELESPRAAVISIMMDWDAIIQPQRPDWQIEAEAEAVVIAKAAGVAERARPRLGKHLTAIIKKGETDPDTLFFVLFKNRNAVFQGEEIKRVATDRLFVQWSRLARTHAA